MTAQTQTKASSSSLSKGHQPVQPHTEPVSSAELFRQPMINTMAEGMANEEQRAAWRRMRPGNNTGGPPETSRGNVGNVAVPHTDVLTAKQTMQASDGAMGSRARAGRDSSTLPIPMSPPASPACIVVQPDGAGIPPLKPCEALPPPRRTEAQAQPVLQASTLPGAAKPVRAGIMPQVAVPLCDGEEECARVVYESTAAGLPPARVSLGRGRKLCPSCHEKTKSAKKVCPTCGHEFSSISARHRRAARLDNGVGEQTVTSRRRSRLSQRLQDHVTPYKRSSPPASERAPRDGPKATKIRRRDRSTDQAVSVEGDESSPVAEGADGHTPRSTAQGSLKQREDSSSGTNVCKRMEGGQGMSRRSAMPLSLETDVFREQSQPSNNYRRPVRITRTECVVHPCDSSRNLRASPGSLAQLPRGHAVLHLTESSTFPCDHMSLRIGEPAQAIDLQTTTVVHDTPADSTQKNTVSVDSSCTPDWDRASDLPPHSTLGTSDNEELGIDPISFKMDMEQPVSLTMDGGQSVDDDSLAEFLGVTQNYQPGVHGFMEDSINAQRHALDGDLYPSRSLSCGSASGSVTSSPNDNRLHPGQSAVCDTTFLELSVGRDADWSPVDANLCMPNAITWGHPIGPTRSWSKESITFGCDTSECTFSEPRSLSPESLPPVCSGSCDWIEDMVEDVQSIGNGTVSSPTMVTADDDLMR